MTEAAPCIPDEARPDDVGRLLGLTPRRVRQICVEHGIVSGKRGLVPVAPVIRVVVEAAKQAKDGDALSAAKARREAAKAKLIELDVAKAEGSVIDLAEHFAVVEELVGLFVSALSSMPARAARHDPRARQRIEAACDQVRREIADAAVKRAGELRASGKGARP